MTDHEATFAALWVDYGEGRIRDADWHRLLEEVPGLQRWVRQAREREMVADKKQRQRARHP
jgi:hypothetical protein